MKLLNISQHTQDTNCPDCRDQYGHYCKNLSTDDDNNLQCVSVQESCDLFLENNQQSCPTTCLECPTYVPTNPSTCWYLLMLAGMATPICVWLFLPFLRGKRNRDDHFYGLTSCTKNRVFGICGAQEDYNDHLRVDGHQLYGHVEGEGFASEAGNGSIIAHGDDVELT